MAYGIIALIAVGVVAYFLISRKSNATEQPNSVREHQLEQNPFEGLRNQAFSVTKEQLELTDDNKFFGLIMDWELGDATMTLITFRTGDASMYLSSGGGVIGGGQHENVRTAVANYLNSAERFLNTAEPVEHSNLPTANSVNFYFLTTDGRSLTTENMANFENESSKVYELFNEANNVITELRLTTER